MLLCYSRGLFLITKIVESMTLNYVLIHNADGYLVSCDGQALRTAAHGDDACYWQTTDDGYRHALTGRLLTGVETEIGTDLQDHNGNKVSGGPFRLTDAPPRLASEILATLNDQGFAIIERLMSDREISQLKEETAVARAKDHADETPKDGNFWITDSLIWSVDVARAVTHPVALWVMQQYMSSDEIHFCHQPIVNTLKPADKLKGQFPEGGWHSDYPYHGNVFPNNDWPEQPVFGVQFNICIDEFRADNAATQYVPDSYKLRKLPPQEINTGGTRMGEAIHKEVKQWIAPAGSAVIYDSRMWHRACHELNVSGLDRIAVLNAVSPAYVQPMMNKSNLGRQYPKSPVAAMLTERENIDIDRLCCRPMLPLPQGMPAMHGRTPE